MATAGVDNPTSQTLRCRDCGSLTEDFFVSRLPVSASSAFFPVSRPARVGRCPVCGLIQKSDQDLAADYLHYDMHDNDPASDKIIRRPGEPQRTRSQYVAELVLEGLGGERRGRVLEIGCHRGEFLSALRAKSSEVELYGFDLDPSYVDRIEPICGPGRYYSGDLDSVPAGHDVCVLIHTFEHVPRPLDTLRTIRRLLKPNGLLINVVPDVQANPADFYVIDHCCHFTCGQLEKVVRQAGFDGTTRSDMIDNELVTLVRSGQEAASTPTKIESFPVERLDSLRRFEQSLLRLPSDLAYVLGTAHLGALVAGVLGERCAGFVDEASHRIGKTFLGRKVHLPQEVQNETVVLGVAETVADQVAPRFREMGIRVVNPWES